MDCARKGVGEMDRENRTVEEEKRRTPAKGEIAIRIWILGKRSLGRS